jgi:hypothetical protein
MLRRRAAELRGLMADQKLLGALKLLFGSIASVLRMLRAIQ